MLRAVRSVATRSSRAGGGRSASSRSWEPTAARSSTFGYFVSGRLHVTHEDGSEGEVTAGEVYRIAPGHDAWVVGDEAAVVVEFQGAANYAKPR